MSDPYQAKTVQRLYNATEALYTTAVTIDSTYSYSEPGYKQIAAGWDSVLQKDRLRAQPGIIVDQDKRIINMLELNRKKHEKGLTVAKLKYCWTAMKGVYDPRKTSEK